MIFLGQPAHRLESQRWSGITSSSSQSSFGARLPASIGLDRGAECRPRPDSDCSEAPAKNPATARWICGMRVAPPNHHHALDVRRRKPGIAAAPS
jgi:hypothetical protein